MVQGHWCVERRPIPCGRNWHRAVRQAQRCSAAVSSARNWMVSAAGLGPGQPCRYVSTVIYGMTVQAAGGATRKEARRVAEIALLTLHL